MAAVGYIRVSSPKQNTERQLYGLDLTLDKIFTDVASGANKDRSGLNACIAYVREGDVLYIHSIDRLARNLVELHNLITEFTKSGVEVRFIKNGLTFSPDSDNSPMQTLLFNMLGAFAQFERDLITERRLEGMARARELGRVGGRPAKLDAAGRVRVAEEYCQGATIKELAIANGVSTSTIYKILQGNRATIATG